MHIPKWWLSIVMVALVASLTGCPQPAEEEPAEEAGAITIVLSSDEAPLKSGELNLKVYEKARIVRLDELESLVVSVDEIQLTRQLNGGSETLTVFDEAFDLDLLNVMGVYEVLHSADIPPGLFVEATLILSNARVEFADNPGTLVPVDMLDGGVLTVPVEFTNEEGEEALLILDLGGLNLTELEAGGYQLIPDLWVDLLATNIPAQVIGQIARIHHEYDELVVEKNDRRIEVNFANAIVFLPEDFDVPTGSHDDLEVEQKVFVYGLLDYTGLMHAHVIVIFPEERPDEGESIKLKWWLEAPKNTPKASGKVEYKAQHGRRQLHIEMHHLLQQEIEGVLIYVDNEFLEDLRVKEGTTKLMLDTREGHFVPRMTDGSVIKVKNARNNEVVLISTLHRPDDEVDRIEVKHYLTGTDWAPEASGWLRFVWERNDDKDGDRDDESHKDIRMEVEGLPEVQEAELVIDGQWISAFKVENGYGDLTLQSVRGDRVPIVTRESVIKIYFRESERVMMTNR
jgi:hypothetical protein